MEMGPEQWRRAKALFSAALAVEPEHRERVLTDLCPDDANLRAEVWALISAHGSRGFVDELAERLTEPDRAAPRTPVRIGRYEVIETIGRGGMGIVYKARDTRLDRLVAVKLLSPERALDDEHRRRLLMEARATAALDHPSIATVYEISETEEGHVFLAMAFYDGETLEARLARGPLPIAEACRVAREMAEGLAAAHARGITHRDLKPGNVLLGRSGAVKLLDFWIARTIGVDDTHTGEVVGTIAYMSPEQLRGERTDARTDVWAFGLVLYEMLTGERPFGAAPAAAFGSDPAPPSRRRPEIPLALDAMVQRALSRKTDERYRDGSELVAALAQLVRPGDGGGGLSQRIVRLPAPVTTFFGREREIQDISERLAAVRLLTLTGPGGVGKTRLAQQVASIVQASYRDGVAFVSLAPISDPDLVCSEVARVIGVPEPPALSPVDALASFLLRRRMLLILDNFEHVTLAAPALSRLLADCGDLRVLVTSRVPLKLAGEHEYPVPTLPQPPQGVPDTAAVLDAYPASALFLDRVRAVRPDFAVTDDEACAVVELCRHLDGLPLAIELAAVRAKLLSPRAMLARLDQRLDLLSARGHDRPARHHSLRHAIAWSYDLLQPDEQALFRALSVFVGGSGLEDMAAVSQALVPGAGEVFDRCEALIDHSLVLRDEGPDGLPRLRMLETIREYALERLQAAGEAQAARRAHADRFLALAEQAATHLTGPDQAEWFDRLEVEHANVRTALSWAQAEGRANMAMRFGSALWRFWAARGHLREGRDRLEQLLAMPDTDRPTLLRARVLHGAATLIHEISEYSSARLLAEESLAIARRHGDRPLTALVLNNVAWLLVRMGDAGAEAVCEEALALNRELDDRRGIAIALHNRGWLAASCGDHDRACALHEEGLEWRRAHGDPRGIAYAMTDLAWAEMQRGALHRASGLLDDARSTLEQLGDRQILAWTLAMQGRLERAAGRPTDALERFEMSIRRWRAVGNIFGLAFSLVGEAEVALDQGDRQRAWRDLQEALPLLRRSGDCWGLGDALRARARLAELEGDRERARPLYAESLELSQRLGDPRAIAECQDALRRLADVPPTGSS